MRLLIVDDDAGFRQSLALLLGESGYEVEAEGDPERALARATAEAFDLILCDVKMPGMDRPKGNSVIIYFSCEDCAVEAKRAGENGGKIFKEKFSIGQHGFIALVHDTEGNMIGLHSRK